MNGGRSGRDAGPLPEPDCPDSQPNCAPCATPYDCTVFGTVCDVYRNYCAPFCGTAYDGSQVQCFDRTLPACDRERNVCVECTSTQAHCKIGETCEQGKCVPPECFGNDECENPKPLCFEGKCGPCRYHFDCDPDEHCDFGRCEPGAMP
jgi:hypothetical protein